MTDYKQFLEAVENDQFGYFELKLSEFDEVDQGYSLPTFVDSKPCDYLAEHLGSKISYESSNRLMSEYIDMDRFVRENYFLIQFISNDGKYREGSPEYFRYFHVDEHDPFGIEDYVLEGKSLPKKISKLL